MSYIALARKWRPQTFEQLVGQENLANALINSLNKNRLHHAYLFTGTRGVGKTSVARIFAKALNCEQGISANPCLTCQYCIAFSENRFIDLVEIDGASKTKVEDTRELLENIQYAPTSGRFKIYLIDEVHMLSQHSFNALLKTLEEPPQHVKFLLATTDPQKLPITVLSRCLQFNLKTIDEQVITNHLINILSVENINFEKEAIILLAKAAKGSIRDALSLLDQAIVSCDDHININKIKDLLGYTKQDYALQILYAIINSDPQQLITISQQINNDGGLYNYVIDEVIGYLHKIAIHQAIANSKQNSQSLDEISDLSNKLTPEDTQLIYQIALKGRSEMLLAPTIIIGFEILLLRMYAFIPEKTHHPLGKESYSTNITNSNTNTHLQYQDSILSKNLNGQQASEISNKNQPEILYATTNNTTPISKDKSKLDKKGSLVKILKLKPWHEIILQLSLSGLTQTAAENSQLIEVTETGITLVANKTHETIFTPTVIKNLESSLSKYCNQSLKINFKFENEANTTPAKIKEQSAKENILSANESLNKDSFFQLLQDEFSAELIKNSIASLKDDV